MTSQNNCSRNMKKFFLVNKSERVVVPDTHIITVWVEGTCMAVVLICNDSDKKSDWVTKALV